MKIRVTIMTENDKHRLDVPKEKIEQVARTGWNQLLTDLTPSDEKAYVESCELVED